MSAFPNIASIFSRSDGAPWRVRATSHSEPPAAATASPIGPYPHPRSRRDSPGRTSRAAIRSSVPRSTCVRENTAESVRNVSARPRRTARNSRGRGAALGRLEKYCSDKQRNERGAALLRLRGLPRPAGGGGGFWGAGGVPRTPPSPPPPPPGSPPPAPSSPPPPPRAGGPTTRRFVSS